MKKLIGLLKGDIDVVKLKDGKMLRLITSRDTNNDSETGFYLDIPLGDGNFDKIKISNTLGYSLLSNM